MGRLKTQTSAVTGPMSLQLRSWARARGRSVFIPLFLYLKYLPKFLKRLIFIYICIANVCVSVWLWLCAMYVGVPQEARRGHQIPCTRVTGGGKPTDMGPGNWTWMSTRAVSTYNHWAIAHYHRIILNKAVGLPSVKEFSSWVHSVWTWTGLGLHLFLASWSQEVT